MTTLIHLDFETRSECDIKKGATLYASHPSTEVLGACYAIDDGEINTWAPWKGMEAGLVSEMGHPQLGPWFRLPTNFSVLLKRTDSFIVAHNAAFEFAIWHHCLKWPAIPLNRWVCSHAAARYTGLPGDLKTSAKVMKLTHQKASDAAMKKMCKPRPTWVRKKTGPKWFGDAELYKELMDYCAIDVETERELFDRCFKLPWLEKRVWQLDQAINHHGIPCDLEFAYKAAKLNEELEREANERLKVLTDGAVTSASEVKRILGWLTKNGAELPNLQAGTIERALDSLIFGAPHSIREVLTIRKNISGTASKKYLAFLENAGLDWRVRDSLLYYGAHTGRWTSKRVQFQNMKKTPDDFHLVAAQHIADIKAGKRPDVDDVSNTLDMLTRFVVTAEPGHLLAAIDYSAIEARFAAWIARQENALAGYYSKVDRYVTMAMVIFNKTRENVTKWERAVGKAAVLGANYGMGWKRFVEACAGNGIVLTPELAETTITQFRKVHPQIVGYWHRLDEAVFKALESNETTIIRDNVIVRALDHYGIRFLEIVLPSGRSLYYPHASIHEGKFRYLGRLPSGKADFVTTWGGGLFENIVQAGSRDLLAYAMLKIAALPDTQIIMSVHDEPVLQIKEEVAQERYEQACAIMRAGCPWTTLGPRTIDTLPIEVEGWIGRRYHKE